jgi:hypothetical protein
MIPARQQSRPAVLVAVVFLAIMALGCGDGVIIVSVNTGIIASDPFCDSGAGHFDLRNQGGLLLLVVISSDTVIVNPDGRPGRCTDLTFGAHADVTGPQQGTQITARSVTLE